MLNLQRIFQLLSGQRLDLKPYLEVKGRDKMATKDKQAFLTNHLLAFGIAGDEPITNTLKLNEAGIIVDHANPEAQQTRSEEHTSELQSPLKIVCRILLE